MQAALNIALVSSLSAFCIAGMAMAEDVEETQDAARTLTATPLVDPAPDEALVVDAGAAADTPDTEIVVQQDGAIPEDGIIEFDVYRKGDRIGTHTLTFTRDADQLTVDVDVNFKVDFLFITVYRYEHEAKEVWQAGQLQSFTSETVQNGKEWFVNAEWNNEEMVVQAKTGTQVLDEFLFPTSYWNIASLNTPRWFNTQFGSPIEVNVQPLGGEMVDAEGGLVEALRYNVTAMIEETQKPVDLDIWYGLNGELVKLQFAAEDGSLIEYKRVS